MREPQWEESSPHIHTLRPRIAADRKGLTVRGSVAIVLVHSYADRREPGRRQATMCPVHAQQYTSAWRSANGMNRSRHRKGSVVPIRQGLRIDGDAHEDLEPYLLEPDAPPTAAAAHIDDGTLPRAHLPHPRTRRRRGAGAQAGMVGIACGRGDRGVDADSGGRDIGWDGGVEDSGVEDGALRQQRRVLVALVHQSAKEGGAIKRVGCTRGCLACVGKIAREVHGRCSMCVCSLQACVLCVGMVRSGRNGGLEGKRGGLGVKSGGLGAKVEGWGEFGVKSGGLGAKAEG
eukprot:6104750-Prymnesium_polylepis.1